LIQDTETIGSRLVKLRETRKLSQSKVARLTGIQKSNLSQIENDIVKPGADNSKKLADFFGVTTDYILRGKKTPVENASETKVTYTCEIKFLLPDPSNELVEDLNLIRDVLEHGDPQHKGWLEGELKWIAWKLKNWREDNDQDEKED
jgi:transcriptional regulator with XRE-family HTH domain